MANEEKVTSYILVGREQDTVFYVAYGSSRLTSDLKEARRYSRRASADIALRKMAKNPKVKVEILKVEAIDE